MCYANTLERLLHSNSRLGCRDNPEQRHGGQGKGIRLCFRNYHDPLFARWSRTDGRKTWRLYIPDRCASGQSEKCSICQGGWNSSWHLAADLALRVRPFVPKRDIANAGGSIGPSSELSHVGEAARRAAASGVTVIKAVIQSSRTLGFDHNGQVLRLTPKRLQPLARPYAVRFSRPNRK